MRVSNDLVQALAALGDVQESLERTERILQALESELERNAQYTALSHLAVIRGILGGTSEYCGIAEDHIYDSQHSIDEPSEFEIYPPPDTLADAIAAKSALQGLGLNLWGIE
jgi:hypothetical protein